MVDEAEKKIARPLSPAPRNDQPASDVVASPRFHNSSHSSAVDSDDPAQATSPMRTLGVPFVVCARANSEANGLKMLTATIRVHETRRTRDGCLVIGQ